MKSTWDIKTSVPTLKVIMALSVYCTLCSCGPIHDAPVVSSASAGGLTTAMQAPGSTGITMGYLVEHAGVAGQAITVTLNFSTVGKALSTTRITADAGLRLLSALPSYMTLPSGLSQLVLQVIPQNEGLLYLNVFTTQGEVTSVTSVPVGSDDAIPRLEHLGDIKALGNRDHIIAIPVP